MVVKDNTRPNRNLMVAFSDSYTGPYTAPSEPFTDTFVEGPSVAKVGNEYYIYFDAYREMIYGSVSTTDFINFTDRTQEVSIPVGHKHGTVSKAPASVLENLLNQTKDNQSTRLTLQ